MEKLEKAFDAKEQAKNPGAKAQPKKKTTKQAAPPPKPTDTTKRPLEVDMGLDSFSVKVVPKKKQKHPAAAAST